MRIGIIIESPRGSADAQIFKWLIEKFCPDMEVTVIGNRNKTDLLNDFLIQTETLLSNDKCDKVLIIYDFMPKYPRSKNTPIVDPEKSIRNDLANKNINEEIVEIICIKQMLETWLILDENAVTRYKINIYKLKGNTPKFNGGKQQVNNPKPKNLIADYLNDNNMNGHALGIMQETNLTIIQKNSTSFRKFKKFIDDNCI